MAKLKIGIECESIEGKNPQWGVARMIMRLLEEISRRPELEKSHKFILYFKDNIPNFPFLSLPIFKKRITPVPFFRCRLFPIYYFALLPMRLWFDRPNIMFWPNYMLPIIACGRSVVMLTEDAYYEYRYGVLPFRYKLSYGIFTNWAAKFATKILAISETSKKEVAKVYKINPDKIFVNYLGIDLSYNDPGLMTNALNIRPSTFDYVLFVGQMFPRRHARETILAFEKLAADHSNILQNVGMIDLKLILIGPDKYPESTINSLVAQVNKRLGREAIVHKDYVEDSELVELYADAKALIYVSDREAFGLPPMEALSFGVPPIVMDNELGHELFGEYAFYSKSGSVDDIAETIKEAMSNEPRALSIRINGPEFVKKYNWKSFADRFLKTVSIK